MGKACFASAVGAAVLATAWTVGIHEHAAAQPSVAPAPTPAVAGIPEGTEFRLRLDDKVSSKTSSAGDRFRVTMTSPTTLPDGTVIPAGYRGVGEVVDAQASSALGAGGGLSVKVNYLRIGEIRIRLRGAQAVNGKANEAGAAVMSFLTGLGGIMVHGADAELDPGQNLVAFADEDTVVPLPLAAPPAG